MEDVIKKSQKMEFSLRSRSHGTGRIRDRAQIRPNLLCVNVAFAYLFFTVIIWLSTIPVAYKDQCSSTIA